jgi:sulfoxide reductase catalytic subunit YedY
MYIKNNLPFSGYGLLEKTMLIKSQQKKPIRSAEITPEQLYLNRREFIKTTALAAGITFLAACGRAPVQEEGFMSDLTPEQNLKTTANRDELGARLTSYEAITHYNNFYEFTVDKEGVAELARKFKTNPWQVEVGGLVEKPKTFAIEDLLTQEERIYRLRCVEGWSMVIPWNGFSLARLLNEVQPLSSARYVRFSSIMRPEEMPGQNAAQYPWPYQEGLRMDEAMHDLTLLATGLYGKSMPAQNGAPLRLVVPWKYGFKSIKSIVKIELVAEQPATLWSSISPSEYGFYSNVNPQRPHPRWSQASERRIGESDRQDTLMFNGYAEEVAALYKDMDLMVNY